MGTVACVCSHQAKKKPESKVSAEGGADSQQAKPGEYDRETPILLP